MRKILILSIMLFGLFNATKVNAQAVTKSIYDIKIEGLDGTPIDLKKYKGKKILIVNTASKCGLTPQYEGLEKLYEKYNDKLVIIGMPANNFLYQEPGSNSEIGAFCKKNYGVSFPMGAKIDVKGKNMHPLYIWLTTKKWNQVSDSSVKWNFQKYLIDEQGNFQQMFAPSVDPMADEIINAINS
jgi:glutathione peroxidase